MSDTSRPWKPLTSTFWPIRTTPPGRGEPSARTGAPEASTRAGHNRSAAVRAAIDRAVEGSLLRKVATSRFSCGGGVRVGRGQAAVGGTRGASLAVPLEGGVLGDPRGLLWGRSCSGTLLLLRGGRGGDRRSEERRVGNECRSRRAPDQ